MRFATPFYFAVVLVTDGAAGHGYPKQQFQNSVHRHGICLLNFSMFNLVSFVYSMPLHVWLYLHVNSYCFVLSNNHIYKKVFLICTLDTKLALFFLYHMLFSSPSLDQHHHHASLLKKIINKTVCFGAWINNIIYNIFRTHFLFSNIISYFFFKSFIRYFM